MLSMHHLMKAAQELRTQPLFSGSHDKLEPAFHVANQPAAVQPIRGGESLWERSLKGLMWQEDLAGTSGVST